MSLACGIDVGGTKIAGGVVDDSGRIVEELRVESPATDAEAIEDAIAGLVARLRERHDITSVGVGAAGYIDKSRAVVLFAPNLAWRDLDLKEELEARISLPVVVENDANAAAWGEFAFGAGHDVDDLLLITVGTGVGGGVVLDGELYRGAFGVGAEIGHLRVVPDGHLCGCGNRGCLEQYASGSALVREARAAARGGSLLARDLLDLAGGDPDAITGPMVTECRLGGRRVLRRAAGRPGSLARRGHRLPDRRPGPRGRRHRWRRRRGRRPAARADPRGVPVPAHRARAPTGPGDPPGPPGQHRRPHRRGRPRPALGAARPRPAPGRPGLLVSPRAEPLVVGIDVGGTKVLAAEVDADGVVRRAATPLDAGTPGGPGAARAGADRGRRGGRRRSRGRGRRPVGGRLRRRDGGAGRLRAAPALAR